ncbi:hypothetical protein ACVR1G_06865 [Streptococcus dentasini]
MEHSRQSIHEKILAQNKAFLDRQKQMLIRQQKRRKDFLKQQTKKNKAFLLKATTGETGLRYARLGRKAGYAVAGAGALVTLISPLNGLGLLAAGTTTILSNHYRIKRLKANRRYPL